LLKKKIFIPEEADKLSKKTLESLQPEEQGFYLAKLFVIRMKYEAFYSFLDRNPEAWSEYEQKLCHFSNYDEVKKYEEIQKFLKNNEKYQKFWKDEDFRNFMTNTSSSIFDGAFGLGHKFPEAPDEAVVSALMSSINLIMPGPKLNNNVEERSL